MIDSRQFLAACVLAGLAVGTGAAQQQLTPRDVFWSASDLVSVPANHAAPKHDTRPARPSTPAAHPHKTTEAQAAAPEKHIDPSLVASSGYGAAPHLVHVSLEQMGLRYSLLLQNVAGEYTEVSPQHVFHSGERIRLSIMANQPGYLYVIERGSSGNWSPIYPAAGAAPEANHVNAGQVTVIPGRSAFRFDPPAGEEKVFVIMSRERLNDLDATIENLKSGGATQRPAPGGQTLEAMNHIPDDLVQHFASRDLTLVQEQQVDDNTANDDGEKAVYVVSKGIPPGAPGPEVVAAITLRHE